MGLGASSDPFHVKRPPFLVQACRWDSFHELMPGIDVEDQNAMAAVFEVIANARGRDIEQVALSRSVVFGGRGAACASGGHQDSATDPQKDFSNYSGVHATIIASHPS